MAYLAVGTPEPRALDPSRTSAHAPLRLDFWIGAAPWPAQSSIAQLERSSAIEVDAAGSFELLPLLDDVFVTLILVAGRG